MFRNGRWFRVVVAGCVSVVAADVFSVGPFAEPRGRPEVEVLGDVLEREPTDTTTSSVVDTTTTMSEDEALEQLDGLDQETLDALESIKGVDPAELPDAPSTTP